MSHVLVSADSGVTVITLSRADKFNSFVRQMALDFQQALDEAAADASVRCVLITGSGKAFSAGQDLIEATDPEGIPLTRIVSEHYNPVIRKIRQMPKPVIAAVNGVAAGAGANIALACDIVIAAESASFIQAFSKIGLIPDSGGTYTLPRLVGMQRASALMMTGDKIMAREAFAMGMVYKVYPDEVFAEEAMRLATHMATMPTYGLALTKQALNKTFSHSLNEQLALEDHLQTLAGNSDDYREGTEAFLQKRKPLFKGS